MKAATANPIILTTVLLLCAAMNTYADSARFEISSAAFNGAEPIPPEFSCTAANRSPGLRWQGVPAKAKSLALIVSDPDAPGGTFIHWVVYGLAASSTGLAAGQPADPRLPGGAYQGTNGFGHIAYDGPCPPPGPVHHYHFRLLALDTPGDSTPGESAEQVESSAKGHIVGEAELAGTFQR